MICIASEASRFDPWNNRSASCYGKFDVDYRWEKIRTGNGKRENVGFAYRKYSKKYVSVVERWPDNVRAVLIRTKI